jgi:LysM repeat protein
MSGETFAGIARKQGVSLVALEEANPHVNPGKIRAGQVLNLPPP